jgi:CRISPR/Cas system-associated protein Cas7 (RAMP superfamily)
MFERVPSDTLDAPKKYIVRIKGEDGKFLYFSTYKEMAQTLNCSKLEAKNFLKDRRTIDFEEYFGFRLMEKS